MVAEGQYLNHTLSPPTGFLFGFFSSLYYPTKLVIANYYQHLQVHLIFDRTSTQLDPNLYRNITTSTTSTTSTTTTTTNPFFQTSSTSPTSLPSRKCLNSTSTSPPSSWLLPPQNQVELPRALDRRFRRCRRQQCPLPSGPPGPAHRPPAVCRSPTCSRRPRRLSRTGSPNWRPRTTS